MGRRAKILSVLFAIALTFTVAVTAFTSVEDTGFSDVAADAWYAEAVAYCHENGIMSGTTDTEFEPQTPMSRAMLAAVLWRMDGSPAAAETQTFADVAS